MQQNATVAGSLPRTRCCSELYSASSDPLAVLRGSLRGVKWRTDREEGEERLMMGKEGEVMLTLMQSC